MQNVAPHVVDHSDGKHFSAVEKVVQELRQLTKDACGFSAETKRFVVLRNSNEQEMRTNIEKSC